MKKLLSFFAAWLICMGAQAQLVETRSSILYTEKAEKQPSHTQWYVRVGLNIMNMAGDGAGDTDCKAGYNVMFGFNKPLGSAGGYWGMDFGLNSRGFKVDGGEDGDIKSIAHSIQISPFTYGWKFNVGQKFTIDPHVGLFLSCDYASNMKGDEESMSWSEFASNCSSDYNMFDVGLSLGVGVWYDRFNLDLNYQHGFIDVFDDLDSNKSSNFTIRLGVAF